MTFWTGKTMHKEKLQSPPPREITDRLRMTRELASRIALFIPHRHGDGVNAALLEYCMQWLNVGIKLVPMVDTFGGFMDIFRASMVHKFLREMPEREYMVQLDNDVLPRDAESLLRLCGHGLPVVSGIVCTAQPNVGVMACVAVKDEAGTARFPTLSDTGVMPMYGLRECELVGAGYFAVRRDVFETLQEPPFIIPDELRIEAARIGVLRAGEDIVFSQQVRRAGHQLYADFSCHCIHFRNGIPVAWDLDKLDPNLDPKDWDVTRRAYMIDRALEAAI